MDNKRLRHRLTYHPTIQHCFRAPVLNIPNAVTLTSVLHDLVTPTTNLFLWLLHNYEFAAVMNPIVNICYAGPLVCDPYEQVIQSPKGIIAYRLRTSVLEGTAV